MDRNGNAFLCEDILFLTFARLLIVCIGRYVSLRGNGPATSLGRRRFPIPQCIGQENPSCTDRWRHVCAIDPWSAIRRPRSLNQRWTRCTCDDGSSLSVTMFSESNTIRGGLQNTVGDSVYRNTHTRGHKNIETKVRSCANDRHGVPHIGVRISHSLLLEARAS